MVTKNQIKLIKVGKQYQISDVKKNKYKRYQNLKLKGDFVLKITKKDLKLRIILCVILAIYVILFFIMYFVDRNNFFIKYWIFNLLAFIGNYMLIKGWFFNSDSSLWLGNFLVNIPIVISISQLFNIEYVKLTPIYIMVCGIGNLAIFVRFKNYFHLKLFIVLTLVFLPFILFTFNCISIYFMLILLCISIIIGILLFRRKYGRVQH